MRAKKPERAKDESTPPLPEELRPLFWDTDFDALTLAEYQSFIVRRIVETANWDATVWLRKTVGDAAIAEWFLQTKGRGLEPETIDFWGHLLSLPQDQTDEWAARERNSVWGRRVSL